MYAYNHDFKVSEILISFIFPVSLVLMRLFEDIKLTK